MSQCRAVRPVPAQDTAQAFYFEVEAPGRTYLINADSADSRDSWVQTIQDAIDKMSLKRQDGALTVVRRRGLRAQQLVASGVADPVHTLCVDPALSLSDQDRLPVEAGRQGGQQGLAPPLVRAPERLTDLLQDRDRMFQAMLGQLNASLISNIFPLGRRLFFVARQQDKKILGRLNLSLLNSIVPADPLQVRRENCFKLYFAGRTYIIGAETPEEREEWMEILAASAPENAARATGAAAVHEVCGLPSPVKVMDEAY